MLLNPVLAVLMVLAQLLQLFVLPLWLLPQDPRWGWLLLPMAALTLPLWALVHDCFHGSFSPRPQVNGRVGRVLAVGFGAPYQLLRTGHLLHHKYNRGPRDRSEVYDDARGSWLGMAPSYYFRLLGGLYFYELLAVPLLCLPRAWVAGAIRRVSGPDNVVEHMGGMLLRPKVLREMRQDALAVMLLLALSAWCYGAHAWMLVLALAGRGLVISMHDNSYHYDTPLEGAPDALTLRLPALLSPLVLNFNFHDTHHRHPQLGWRELPAAHRRDGGRFDIAFGTALLRQLRGPLPLSRVQALAPKVDTGLHEQQGVAP